MNWGLTAPEFLSRVKKGYVRVGSLDEASPQKYPISYLTSSYIDDIESGRAKIIKYAEDGHVICQYQDIRGTYPTTQWDKNTHDAKTFGTDAIIHMDFKICRKAKTCFKAGRILFKLDVTDAFFTHTDSYCKISLLIEKPIFFRFGRLTCEILDQPNRDDFVRKYIRKDIKCKLTSFRIMFIL